MTNERVPVQGAERAVPCMQCLRSHVQDVLSDSHSKRCHDQITAKNKARVCFQCWEKKRACTPVDADDPYVKEWLDVHRRVPAADPMDCWEKAYRLDQHLQQAAVAVSSTQQSQYDTIIRSSRHITADISFFRGFFEETGNLAAYSTYLSPSHPMSARYSGPLMGELQQEFTKCKTLDDALVTIAGLANKAAEEVKVIDKSLKALMLRQTTSWDHEGGQTSEQVSGDHEGGQTSEQVSWDHEGGQTSEQISWDNEGGQTSQQVSGDHEGGQQTIEQVMAEGLYGNWDDSSLPDNI